MRKTILALTLILALFLTCHAALAEQNESQAPDIKVYYSVANLAFDCQPYLDAVGEYPTFWLEDDGVLYVNDPDRLYTSVMLDVQGGAVCAGRDDNRYPNPDAWHIGGLGKDWQPDETQTLSITVTDEHGLEIKAVWGLADSSLRELLVTLAEDIIGGYNSVRAVAGEDMSLRIDSLLVVNSEEETVTVVATYGEDGLLSYYFYGAKDGMFIQYLVEDGEIVPPSYLPPESLEAYPPLELVME